MRMIQPLRGWKRAAAWAVLILASVSVLAVIVSAAAGQVRTYPAEKFGFSEVKSDHDGDGDGIEDHADLILGAENFLSTVGVMEKADGELMLIRAFAQAGYDLAALIDADVEAAPEAYAELSAALPALLRWFERNTTALPVETYTPSDWMAGDIAFLDGCVCICSYERNASGLPYLYCADGVTRCADSEIVRAHFRFH